MTDKQESAWVEATVEHTNSYGDKFEKAKGDRYEVPDADQRALLINSKLVKSVAEPKAAEPAKG